MKTYYIYAHINKQNQKIYIGQTCQKPEYRWNKGQGYKNCTYFYKAIKKYGWDNFEHIILENNLSLEEANKKEKYYIQFYNSTNPIYGYNLTFGGNNSIKFSKTTCKKISERMKKYWKNEERRLIMSQKMKKKWQENEYKYNHFIGMKKAFDKIHSEGKTTFITEQGRKRISEARKLYIKKYGTPTQGKGHTEETKKKISKAQMGKNNSHYGKKNSEYQKARIKEVLSKKIQCVETLQIFNSIQEAATWAGLKSSSGISDFLKGRKKSAGKHPITKEKLHWRLIN